MKTVELALLALPLLGGGPCVIVPKADLDRLEAAGIRQLTVWDLDLAAQAEWSVRFEVKRFDVLSDPLIHVSMLVRAASREESIMRATSHLKEVFLPGVMETLKFYDAQLQAEK